MSEEFHDQAEGPGETQEEFNGNTPAWQDSNGYPTGAEGHQTAGGTSELTWLVSPSQLTFYLLRFLKAAGRLAKESAQNYVNGGNQNWGDGYHLRPY